MSCELDPHLLLLHHPLDDGPLLWSEMGQIWPLAALARKSRGSTSSMEKPVKGRLVVHPEKKTGQAPRLLSLPQRENCFSQQQGQGHTLRVVCERKRAEEALFLQYDPALCRLSHHRQEISPWIVKMEWSTTMPSPSLTSCPAALLCSWGGAEVGGGAGVVRSSCRPHHHRGCD